MKAPLPSNEAARLLAVSNYEILDTAIESVFDDLTRLAAYICGVPTAMISLIDRDRQWFKSKLGIEILQTARDDAFCAHAILQIEPLIIPDAELDERFADNPLVTGKPGIRFYAGAPLIDPEGFSLGTLCVIDYVPRQLSNEQQDALVVLSRQVMTQLRLRRNLVALQESTTQCQKADETLQKVVRFQQGILDGANYSIISTTKDGIIQTVNAATERWLGYTATELIGQTPGLIHDLEEVTQYAGELSQKMGRTIEAGFEVFVAKARYGQVDEREWTYIRSDGSRFPVMLSVTALRDRYDNIIGFIGIAKDISDRIQVQEALKKSEQKLAMHFEQTPVAILEWDLNFNITNWNRAAENIFGYYPQEAIGCHATGLLVPEAARSDVERVMTELLTQAGGAHHINENITKDGKTIVCEWFNTPLVDSNGDVVGVASLAQDISDRFNAEKALQESEKNYRSVVDNVKEVIFQTDAMGLWTFLNPAWTEITEFTIDESLGTNFLDYIHESDRQQNLEFFLYLLQRQQQYCRHEVRYLTKYGGYRWIEVYARLTLDEQGNILGTSGTLQDITENKQAAAALRESEKLFKAVFDQAFQFIGLLTCDGVVLEVNQTALDFAGVKLKEVVGHLFWETTWWRHSPVVQIEQLKDAIYQAQAGNFVRYEVEIVGTGNIVVTVDFSIKPVTDEIGNVVLLLLEGRDITERKQTEAAFRSSLATNHALVNALPDLMFRISADGIFVNFKASKTHQVPIPPEEFLGKSVCEVMPTDVAELTMNGIKNAIATGELQVFECQMFLNDPTCQYEARISVSGENEAIVIVRDITERKRAETEVSSALKTEKHLNELKSRFVSMTSHEFRTPLTTILSSAELLEDFGAIWSEEKKQLYFHRIKDTVKHMTQLLDDVMLIGKAEMGKLDCHPILLDVVQFCRDLVDELHPASIRNHHIAFVSQTNELHAYIDEKLLRHILSNLLSNAIKYSPNGGIINFDLDCQQKEVSFKIQDRGIGIPKIEQEGLFSSFYRASNVGNISGTGLGLAIVKKAVDSHQGKIAVESAVGIGSTFLVSIPLTTPEKIYE
ncbi:PAS domain S-box protein [Synechocystis sp. PCC 7509]|uniref:PAS domain S-box protein n=1 Tax=Synechocystis sp. PCC 7509 TaxID=927677 RepID=UPI0002ACE33C|nr:PAS domain S-box protein [Synechocystis sp. PCC 7509]